VTETAPDVLHSFTLGDLLREHRRSRSNFTAVVDNDVRLTYAELDIRVNRLASALRQAGVGPGDRIVWLGQNSFRILELLGAAAKLGALLVPANWRQSTGELRFVLDDLTPKVVVWQEEEVGDRVRPLTADPGRLGLWLRHDAGGPGSYEEFLATGTDTDDEATVAALDPVLGMYTAAFDGQPCCAMLTHLGLLVHALTLARVGEISDTTVFLNSGPLFHIGTFMSTNAVLHLGGTNVITRRTDAAEICRLIESERCTRAFIMAPTVAEIRTVNSPLRWDVSSLWGSNDPDAWGMCTPTQSPSTGRSGGYGQTEVIGTVTFYGLAHESVSIFGRPLPSVQLRIVDDAGAELPPGQTGEIVFRGPTVMAGFFNRPEVNRARLADGWLHTRDLGRREPDGSVTFVGPKLRMIKSASENIYPAEVERCLAEHPAVAAAAVLGVPDETWSQLVKAVVVLREGTSAGAEELIEFCRSRIASYKKPRQVVFTGSLPRTATGAIDRDVLDCQYGGGGYPGGSVTSGVRSVPASSRRDERATTPSPTRTDAPR
jgi:acyl-CoA synthetase (AMP-forming)/AMP-acid ligase II